MNAALTLLAAVAGPAASLRASEPDQAWTHSASLFVLTTPEGADLPATAVEHDFPLLVRLHKDFFDFGQAQPHGEDVRFSTPAGKPLPYQIDEWDPKNGTANIWVLLPAVKGNERQEIRMSWGNAEAKSESSGAAVFNASNGYLSVWHMNDPVRDEVGALPSTDVKTTPTRGVIGAARHFAGGQGIACGEAITTYPSGSEPSSTEAWFRADRPNTTLLGWGNEGGGRGSKVRMQFRSPPHLHIDSDFADVNGDGKIPMSTWVHVIHTYQSGEARIYVNGKLDGASKVERNIKNPARMWIGGWYGNYDFVGDLDEVRISNVARSADWIRLEYENQKPLQTLTGLLVQPGDRFSVSRTNVTVDEGQSVDLTAEAGGAQKIYWILKRDGTESVVAVDRLHFTLDAGRVVGDQSPTLQVKAVYSNEVRTKDIAVVIKEALPEPVFTLKAPASWDGRETVEVTPEIVNLADLKAKGVDRLDYRWTVSDMAAVKEIQPGKLILKRALNSGKLTVTLGVSNGGAETARSAVIAVQEPKADPWVVRTLGKEEKPEDNQFYARDDKNEGTLVYNGSLKEASDAVFLRVYAGDELYKNESQQPSAEKAYAFSVKLKPGLIQYRVEFGIRNKGKETVLHTVRNLVCGDAYLIDGQSNAEALEVGKDDPPFTSDWIRSFGSMAGSPDAARLKLWGNAVCRDRNGGKLQVGYWGLELARRLVESQKIPICIINGAVGGTRIDQHQRNPENHEDLDTIYGRLLTRVRQAGLTHGVRGVLWHQGENDQGADGPTGGFGWETYQQYFVEMAANWKEDYPNIQHYYVFQIWPKACSMGINGSDNVLREKQRALPKYFSNLSVMSTLGIKPPGGCHYPIEGYAEFARLICPLVERDNYGKTFTEPITAPDLKRAYYTTDRRDEIALEFGQEMKWSDALASQFYLDGAANKVTSGTASGATILLKLDGPSQGNKITYLDSKSWSENNLLYGTNGIAALTFWGVPITAR